MLRLRCCVLTQLLSSPSSQLHRLFSAAAPAVSPNPSFAVEDYLVATCGLTRAQALKASAKLSHLKSPSKPDAVLAFLAGLGLSGADVAALVAKDPQFLCAKVEKTLAPVVAGLTALGLSHSEIARLVSLSRDKFRSRSILSKLHYYLPLFDSEDLLRVLKSGAGLLSVDLERVVKPNAAFLRECGLSDCDIVKLCIVQPWLLPSSMERIRAMVARASALAQTPDRELQGRPPWRTRLQSGHHLLLRASGHQISKPALEKRRETNKWENNLYYMGKPCSHVQLIYC